MPNHDGGHYFLTVLAPIRVETMDGPVVGRSYAYRQRLAQKLALIPTGRQTAESPMDGWRSPFSFNTLNHFARFVIIDGPAFNGRVSGDSLVGIVRGINPLAPQPVDHLSGPYLLFAADIDAPGKDGDAALRAYTLVLWATMEKDLKDIFGNCDGFDGVDTADKFHAYIRRCQIETSMPFNDYWAGKLDVGDGNLPVGAVKSTAVVAGGAIVLWLAALLLNGLFAMFGAVHGFASWVAAAAAWGAIVVPLLIAVALLALAVYATYCSIRRRAMKPFATAPDSDLPSVLKALAVQQHFTRFAIGAQGLDPDVLYARFGDFLSMIEPGEQTPMQQPGEIRAQ
ncbi:hypothetical protein [Mesorhizobium sp. URHB0026]